MPDLSGGLVVRRIASLRARARTAQGRSAVAGKSFFSPAVSGVRREYMAQLQERGLTDV
jgi:hypothetical protein